MRARDTNLESSRDILKKIEENILSEKKQIQENKNILKFFETEDHYLNLFLDKNSNLNHLTYFKAIEKTQNLNIKW